MLRRLAFAVLVLAAYAGGAGAQVDLNLQNLLHALTEGTEVALLTPATNGMVQVTSFVPPQRLSRAEAASLVEDARRRLADRGIERPTGEQLAAVLAELLPPVALRSEVVFATALPQLIR